MKKLVVFISVVFIGLLFSSILSAEVTPEYIPGSKCPIPKDSDGNPITSLSSICGRVISSRPITGPNGGQIYNAGLAGVFVGIYEPQDYVTIGTAPDGNLIQLKSNTGKKMGKLKRIFSATSTTIGDSLGYDAGFFHLTARKTGVPDNKVYLVVGCGGRFDVRILNSSLDYPNLTIPVNCPLQNNPSLETPPEIDLGGSSQIIGCEIKSDTAAFTMRLKDSTDPTKFTGATLLQELPFSAEIVGFDFRFVYKDLSILPDKHGAMRIEDCKRRFSETDPRCLGPSSDPNSKAPASLDELAALSIPVLPREAIMAFRPVIFRYDLTDFMMDPALLSSHDLVGGTGGATGAYGDLRPFGDKTLQPILDCEVLRACNTAGGLSGLNRYDCGGTRGLLASPAEFYSAIDIMLANPNDVVCEIRNGSSVTRVKRSQIQPENTCDILDPSCLNQFGEPFLLSYEYFHPTLLLPKTAGKISLNNDVINDSFNTNVELSREFDRSTHAIDRDNLETGAILSVPSGGGSFSIDKYSTAVDVFDDPLASPTWEDQEPPSTAQNLPVLPVGLIGTPVSICSVSSASPEKLVDTSNEDNPLKVLLNSYYNPAESQAHATSKTAAVTIYHTSDAIARENVIKFNLVAVVMDAVYTECANGAGRSFAVDLSCIASVAWDVFTSAAGGVLGNNWQAFAHRSSDITDAPVARDHVVVNFPLNANNFNDKFTATANIDFSGTDDQIKAQWGGHYCMPWLPVPIGSSCGTYVDFQSPTGSGEGISKTCRYASCKVTGDGRIPVRYCSCAGITADMDDSDEIACGQLEYENARPGNTANFCSPAKKEEYTKKGKSFKKTMGNGAQPRTSITVKDCRVYARVGEINRDVNRNGYEDHIGGYNEYWHLYPEFGNPEFEVEFRVEKADNLGYYDNSGNYPYHAECAGTVSIGDSIVSTSYKDNGARNVNGMQMASASSANRFSSPFTENTTSYAVALYNVKLHNSISNDINKGQELIIPGGKNSNNLAPGNSPTSFNPQIAYNEIKYYCTDAKSRIQTYKNLEGYDAWQCNTISIPPLTREDLLSIKPDKKSCNLTCTAPIINREARPLSEDFMTVINAAARYYEIPASLLVATMFSEEGQNKGKYSIDFWASADSVDLGYDVNDVLPPEKCSDLTASKQGPYQLIKGWTDKDSLKGALGEDRASVASRCNFVDATFFAGRMLRDGFLSKAADEPRPTCDSFTGRDITRALMWYKTGSLWDTYICNPDTALLASYVVEYFNQCSTKQINVYQNPICPTRIQN